MRIWWDGLGLSERRALCNLIGLDPKCRQRRPSKRARASRFGYFLSAAALTCASNLSAAALWTDVRTRMSGGSTFFP